MDKTTRIEIVSLENAKTLFKQNCNNSRVVGVSLVKDSKDKRKIGKSYHSMTGPKYQTLMRDLKELKNIINYNENEIPSLVNLNKYYDFIDTLKGKQIELFIVHCRRGVSRSAAFAIATVAYVHDISIDAATKLARQFKSNSMINKPKALITPNPVLLRQFSKILETREY